MKAYLEAGHSGASLVRFNMPRESSLRNTTIHKLTVVEFDLQDNVVNSSIRGYNQTTGATDCIPETAYPVGVTL